MKKKIPIPAADITIEKLQKKLEDMSEKCRQFEHILSIAPGHIYWKDANGVYLGCNEAQARTFGYASSNEVTGRTDHDWLPEEEADKVHNNDLRMVKTGKSTTVEEVSTTATGEQCMFLSHKIPMYGSDGKTIKGIIGISLDITDRKKVEKLAFEKVEREAENRITWTKAAAGSIAHDLRTPLASIGFSMTGLEQILPSMKKAYDYAIEHGFKPAKPVRRQKMENILGSVARNQRILKFSHHYIDMVLGNLKHDSINTESYRPCHAVEVIDYALEAYPWEEGERQRLHWDPKVPFDFHGDEFYLQNILNNIVKNACFYIKSAGKGEIFIWTDKEGDCFTLHIKDTALGAPAEVVKKMFDDYYSKREGGTGLGLAFCKSIMASFGGSIVAESVEGEYMEFILRFPCSSE